MDKKVQARFEQHYATTEEPWNYNDSGAERMRFKRVMELARTFIPKPDSVVDVGCSLGQFTSMLAGYTQKIVAVDVSATALSRCEENIKHLFTDCQFKLSNLAALDLPPESVDVIFYLDGINSHLVSGVELEDTIKKTHQLLKPNGIIIFTEYMHYSQFSFFREKVASFGLEVVVDERLNDKLWFHVKSWFKGINHLGWVKQMLASMEVASAISRVSALRGEGGSRHLCMVARKQANSN